MPITYGPPQEGTFARATGAAYRFGRYLAFCGDSITDGSGSTNSTLTSYRALTNKIVGNAKLSKAAINGGVSGDTSGMLLARMDSIIAQAPTLLFVMIGTNDAGNAVPMATYQANILAIKAKADAAGIPILFGLIPPRGSGATTAIKNATRGFNLWLRLWGSTTGTRIVDTHSPLVDATTGSLAAAYDSGDGVHPNDAGHLVIASALGAVLSSTLNAFPWPITTAGVGLLTDPLMTTTGWTDLAGPQFASRSLVAASAGELPAGGWQRFTLSNGASTAQTTAGKSLGSAGSGWAAGDTLLICGYFRASSVTALNKVVLYNQSLSALTNVLESVPNTTPGPVLATYTVPTTGTPTSLSLGIIIKAAANEVATVDIGAVDVINLTTLGLSSLTV